MLSKKKLLTVVASLSLCALLIAGSFAWTNLSSSAINSWTGPGTPGETTGPGGTLHDDYCEGSPMKDVYIENWGDSPLFVRIKLSEYMETGEGAGIKGDPERNKAVSIIEGALIENYSTWRPHAASGNDPAKPSNDVFHEYWKWTMGGQKYYFPASEDVRGQPVGPGGRDYVDSSSPEQLHHLDTNAAGVHAKQTLEATVVTMEAWISMGSPIGNYWVLDADGWAYWAAPLLSGEATGLLMNRVELIKNPTEDYYYGVYVDAQMATKEGPDDDNYKVLLADATEQGKALLNKIVDPPVSKLSIATDKAIEGDYIYVEAGDEVVLYAYSDDGSNDVVWSLNASEGFVVSTDENEAVIRIADDTPINSELTIAVAYAEDGSISETRTLVVMQYSWEVVRDGVTYIMFEDNTYIIDYQNGFYSYYWSAGPDETPGTPDDLPNVVTINGVRYLATDDLGWFLASGPDGKLGTADDVSIYLCIGTDPITPTPPVSPTEPASPTPPVTPTEPLTPTPPLTPTAPLTPTQPTPPLTPTAP